MLQVEQEVIQLQLIMLCMKIKQRMRIPSNEKSVILEKNKNKNIVTEHIDKHLAN